MKSLKQFALSFALCATSFGLFAGNAHAVLEYNFSSMYGGPHVLNVQMYQPACEGMEKATDGKVKLHYFMSGALSKPEEVVPAVMNGNIDMAGIGPHYQDTLFTHSLAFQIPHISSDSRHASAVYWKAYQEMPEVKAELDKVGKVLTIWGSDRAALFSTVGPLKSPADIKGKRILLWSGGQVDQIKAWGGVPVLVSPNDTYMGLQRGMGDAFFGPLPTGVAYKMMEVAKNITVLPATTLFLANIVNWEVWNEMPPEAQKYLMDTMGGEAASKRSGQLLFDGSNKDIETMKAAGCTFHFLTDPEYQAFQDADKPVWTEFWLKDLARLGIKDPAGWLKKVQDLSDSVKVD